jgi:hypothetical protein
MATQDFNTLPARLMKLYENYENLLRQKDATIQKLQEKLEEAKNRVKVQIRVNKMTENHENQLQNLQRQLSRWDDKRVQAVAMLKTTQEELAHHEYTTQKRLQNMENGKAANKRMIRELEKLIDNLKQKMEVIQQTLEKTDGRLMEAKSFIRLQDKVIYNATRLSNTGLDVRQSNDPVVQEAMKMIPEHVLRDVLAIGANKPKRTVPVRAFLYTTFTLFVILVWAVARIATPGAKRAIGGGGNITAIRAAAVNALDVVPNVYRHLLTIAPYMYMMIGMTITYRVSKSLDKLRKNAVRGLQSIIIRRYLEGGGFDLEESSKRKLRNASQKLGEDAFDGIPLLRNKQ